MPIWRLQVSWQVETVAPRDRVVITPHFNDIGATTDPQNLCDDLLAGLEAIHPTLGEIRVKAYDAQGTVPVYPEGDAVVRSGLITNVGVPRELALCLSFYGERNVKRQRGRLYLPAWWLGVNVATDAPTLPITNMTTLVTLLKDLGGPDVDWCVYSRLLDKAFSVTDWWYDSEWDVQRSRGGKALTRVVGTTDEARGAGVEGQVVPLV